MTNNTVNQPPTAELNTSKEAKIITPTTLTHKDNPLQLLYLQNIHFTFEKSLFLRMKIHPQDIPSEKEKWLEKHVKSK